MSIANLNKRNLMMLVLAMAVVFSLIVSSNVNAQGVDLGKQELTVDSYVSYLQKESQTDFRAEQTLTKFKQLSASDKKKFIEYMTNPKVQEDMANTLSTLEKGETKKIYGGDITVSLDTTEYRSSSNNNISCSGCTFGYIDSYASFGYFGIPVSKVGQRMYYYVKRGKVYKPITNNGWISYNYLPLTSYSMTKGHTYTSHNYTRANAHMYWTLNFVYKGFGLVKSWDHKVWGDANRKSGVIVKPI
ncbi:hypothetical protein [Mechercharimyces sp. CAU 1602]|uniref:hypothetical protein n=1 Tax=Mechercharimyces sp. CAU 1602 TaxID=2973933 RepID=UPI002161A48E|nr:hypothetical protein [Mechercharimyces sp. CAU 1602]MCS1350703.1 hypothetical protein [Mechercharimyces sp. CAU 1602]